jgi:hypothetical protein
MTDIPAYEPPLTKEQLFELIQGTDSLLASAPSDSPKAAEQQQRLSRRMNLFASVVGGRVQPSPSDSAELWDLLRDDLRTEITAAVRSIRSAVLDRKIDDVSTQGYDELLSRVLASLRIGLPSYLSMESRVALENYIFSLEDNLTGLQASERAQQFAVAASGSAIYAQASATQASEVASTEATGVLWEHFNSYAKDQTASGTLWRWITILILLGIAGAAIVYVIKSPASESWTEIVRKLLISIPFFAVAGYAARQATEDLRAARWAKETAVLLRTIRAYTSELPEAEQNLVKTVFGTRLFLSDSSSSAHPDKVSEDGNLSGVLSQLQSLTDSIQTLSRQQP